MSNDAEVYIGSGNVFADIGIPNPEEAQAKARLASRIVSIIHHRHLTQSQAAALLGIDQPKVSALIHGRLRGFSTERLFSYLNALGQDIEIIVKPKPRTRASGYIRISSGVRKSTREVGTYQVV